MAARALDRIRPLPSLKGAQRAASDPHAHVWLSASAGTGKTQVLAARVFRLLLRGVDPHAILALTFTKAGAAEMAGRIGERLAAWVRMPVGDLARDLAALGEDPSPELQDRARTLFARVLDAPGGGIRIQTIHSFCQSILAAFPIEAGLTPGFRPLEAREEAALLREALAAMLAGAEREGRTRPIEIVGALSRRLGEGGAEQFLTECARSARALDALPSGIGPWARRALDLPEGDVAQALAGECGGLDCSDLRRIAAANRAWGTVTGTKAAEIVERWMAADPPSRLATLDELASVVLTQKGELKKIPPKVLSAEPDYERLAEDLADWSGELIRAVAREGYADLLADGLEVGRDYARAYAAAKRRAGAVDFDDLIGRTVDLFDQPGIGEWVRYKLDQVTEHVLIDEAQDTNLSQWRIVRALVDEFFVGRGIYAPRTRTLFTVGDYKQAIFGFQGTNPEFFRAAETSFAHRAGEVLDEEIPERDRGLPFERLSLVQSFRSTRPVLEFVDAALAVVPASGLGLPDPTPEHRSEVPGPGAVELWEPVVAGGADADEEAWIEDSVRKNASDIARRIKKWLHPTTGLMLESKGRRLRPEDVMVLVKRRGELASLIVARLYAEGVPVAGVDRLRLNAPLAVQDLLAAVRFVLQPDDDLSLASLLVSPLIGWTQDELMAAAVKRSASLWRHLQATQAEERLDPLRRMLNRADFMTPYAFLEDLLSGELDGRRKLLLRLGAEARDPIEEILNSALQFETSTTPSLQRFLDWFDRGEVEIKRDPSAPSSAVRVMTAHGAKGLQAPLVVLADATIDPTRSPHSVLKWTYEEREPPIPAFRPRAAERNGPIADAVATNEQRELEEHWRLFYVAATRAEERLVIAGSLGAQAKGEVHPMSWYAAADRAFDALAVPRVYGGGERVFRGREPERPVRQLSASRRTEVQAVVLPDWMHRPAPEESRPPRPLAPSAIRGDEVPNPPPSTAQAKAAERGTLVHQLFERLPPCPPDKRRAAADHWLEKVAQVDSPDERASMVDAVMAVIEDARFAELFGPDSLAEAPITAVVDGGVVTGTVDRLLIGGTRVRVVDFKTTRAFPRALYEVPEFHLRQIAAYAAALGAIFPGRTVEAGLLYTAGPELFTLPPELLDRHKPCFAGAEQS